MNLFLIFGFIVCIGIVFWFAAMKRSGKQLEELRRKNAYASKLLLEKKDELNLVSLALQERNKESNEVAKTLVRRDLELTETNERLRELDSIKSEFVSVAAHQLRTPLTGIKWTLNALLEEEVGTLDKNQKKFVSDGLVATYRLIELINDLLDTARLEEGKFGFNFKVDLKDSVIGSST